IARHPNHRKRMTVDGDAGREAWTSYQVLQRLRCATAVQVLLHTGRTHQIRVHFKHIGFPVLGDYTYGQRQSNRVTELTGYTAARIMLHAHRITFTHPRTGRKRSFEAPAPQDFQDAIAALKK